MSRYIDAEDLKAIIKANDWSNPVVPDVVSVIIDRTPTADVVEVVRCKYCLFAEKGFDECDIYCKLNDASFGKDAYCSYGERREQNEG